MLVDNMCDEAMTNDLLSALDDVDLQKASYIINDEKMTFAQTANQLLLGEDIEYILFVTPYVRIDAASIDAMLKIAKASEHHCFVLSNNQKNAQLSQVMDYCKYTYVDAPCVLVRGRLAFNVVEISTEYKTVTGALKAWSMVLSDYGYNTVVATSAIAEGVVEVVDDFIAQMDAQLVRLHNMSQEKLLEQLYEQYYITPFQHFGNELADNKTRKVLFFIPDMPYNYSGTGYHMMECLKGMLLAMSSGIELTVYANDKAAEFWGLYSLENCKIVVDAAELDTYDLAMVVYQLSEERYHRILFKHCLRYVCWPLDIIIARRTNISDSKIISGIERLISNSDGIIFSSKNALMDCDIYYDHVKVLADIPKRVIPIMPAELSNEEADEKLPFDEYYLLFGNGHYHKMMAETIGIAMTTDVKIIVVGAFEQGFISDNIFGYVSGKLSDAFIAKLYRGCKALIFPSIYEGFGLPVVQALNAGKDVIVMDVDMNHELEALSPGFAGHFHYMPSLRSLPVILEDFEPTPFDKLNVYDRNWSDIGRECWDFINEISSKPVDSERLWQRWRILKVIALLQL